ncbi:MAG: hypothetical protein M0D55_19865 [Elusimicrobiota bacterium]|nr:MAG: hypothetical protein M0D55_19865 [Elusimicrobiota bacterium]
MYGRGAAEIAGSTVTVFAAYGGAWLMPSETAARPMGALQFLRAFEDAQDCVGAVVIAPKGRLYVPREQLLDVIIAARAAGATDANVPFSLVRGAAR